MTVQPGYPAERDAVTRRPDAGGWARRIHGVSLVLGVIAALCGTMIMVVIVLDVVLRRAGGAGVRGTDAMVESLLVALVFLGLAYTERRGQHLSFTMFVTRVRAKIAFAFQTLGLLAATLFLSWVAWLSSVKAYESYVADEFRFGMLNLPLWPARAALAIGLVVLVLEMCVSTVDSARSWHRGHAVGVWRERAEVADDV